MRFWDSSALVPLLVKEASSEGVAGLLEEDAHLLVAWITPVELTSTLARLERAGGLDQVGLAQARNRLWALKEAWHEVLPTEEVREAAIRALRSTPFAPWTPSSWGRPWWPLEAGLLGFPS